MNIDSNISKNVFKIKYWTSVTTNDVYVFFNGDENHKKNDELYRDKKTKQVYYMNHIISDSFSIQHIKYTIQKFCNIGENYDELYLWGWHRPNQEYLIHFLHSVFSKEQTQSPSTLIDAISMFFNLNSSEKHQMMNDFTYTSVFDILRKKEMCRTVGFSYLDIYDHLELLNPNPFGKQYIMINQTNLQSKSYMNTLLYTTDILNELNVVSKQSVGMDRNTLYFPNFKDSGDNKSYDVRSLFQHNFHSTDLGVHNWSHKTIYLTLRVLPYTHDLNLNIRHIFNNITTTEYMPLVIFRDRGTNTYKVNQKYLNVIDKQVLTKIKERDGSSNTRGVATLICHFNTNTVRFTLILSRNGSYKIKYSFKKQYFVIIEDISNSFEHISPMLKSIDDVNIHIINRNTNIFNSPYVEVTDYSTNSVISLLDGNINTSLLISNIKQSSLLFDFVNRNNNTIVIKFKEVSNFYNIDSVSNLIYKNRELSDPELIELIQTTFNLSQTDAESELTEKRSNINMNYTKKGKNIFAIRDHHTSVNVRLNIMSDSSIRIVTTNTQHIKYVERLIMYIIYLSQNDVSQIGLNINNVDEQSSNTNTKGPTYDDILENYDEEFDLSAFDDIGLDANIDDRPSVNRETNIDLNDDEEILYNDKSTTEYKKNDYTQIVLKTLQVADPLLFKWTPANSDDKKANYSGKCGAVNFRQPIVINKMEKENIDKNYPDSYTGFVQTGSTEELRNKNYYICPKIWCRVSRVSLSDQDLKKYNNKCPSGEEPLFFPKKGTKNNYFLNRLGQEVHYPILMDKSKHPYGLQMPCCGKVIPKDEKKNETAIYISRVSHKVILDNEKYGVLSTVLDKILNKGMDCVGIIDRTKNCFVRMGTDPNKDSLLDCLQRIYNVEDIISYVCEKLTLEKYIFLNNGHTLKTFIDNYEVSKIYDPFEFEIFKKAMLANKKYVKQFNLSTAVYLLKDMKSFDLKVADEHYGIIMRQFLVFRSFSNFKKYFASDIFYKRIDDVIDLVKYLPTINNQFLNVLFINLDETDVFLINSKYTNIFKTFNFNNDTAIIIQINSQFEVISKITNKTKLYTFASDQIEQLLNMIFVKNKNLDEKKSKKYGDDIKRYVMGMDFKIRGIMREDSKIIPLHPDEVINYELIKNKSFIFIDQVPDFELDWKVISEFNIDETMKKELERKYFNKKDNKLNFKIFVHNFVDDNNNSNEDTVIYNITKAIEKNKKLLSTYRILIHDLAHFTMKEKRFILSEFLNKNKIKIDDSISTYVLHKLLTIDISSFQHYYMNNKLSLSNEEVILTHEDVLEGKLDTIHGSVFSTIFPRQTSIGDYANTITQIKIQI